MGTLIEIGDRRKEPEEMQRLLKLKIETGGPFPLGLYLKNVIYDWQKS